MIDTTYPLHYAELTKLSGLLNSDQTRVYFPRVDSTEPRFGLFASMTDAEPSLAGYDAGVAG